MRAVLKNLSCLFIFLLFSQFTIGQGWERTFNGNDYGRDIAVADNGDVVGIAHENPGLVNFWRRGSKIFRYNEFGQRVFIKNIESQLTGNYIRLHAICKGNDGGYLAAGINYVDRDSFGDVVDHQSHLFKLSESGDVLWEKQYDTPDRQIYFEDIQPTNNGYIITGDVSIGNTRDFKVLLMKLDDNGDEVWQKEYGRLGRGRNIHIDPNGDILVTGNDLISNSSDFVLLKTDSEGNQMWKFDNNLSDIHYGLAVTATKDGGYLAGGHTRGVNGNNSGNLLFRFDSNGDTLETKYLGGSFSLSNNINDIEENQDGSIWLLSGVDGQGTLLKIDSLGNELFRNTIGGTLLQFERVPGGGFYIIGYRSSRISLLKTDVEGNTITNYISGNYSIDNENCSTDSTDIGWSNRIIEIENGNQRNYARTGIDGQYEIRVDTGDYLVKAFPPNDYWEICEDSITLEFDNFYSRDTADFFINKKVDCPYLTVNVGAPFMRRCFENDIHVRYCNDGTTLAENAYIDVTIDDRLTAESSTLPWVSQTDNTFRFEVGDLDVRECGKFQITTTMNCDSVQLGQTLCMEAHIYPDSICTPIDSLWDGSDLSLKATCDGDSVRFEVINNGNTMTRSVDFIIIEDDMVMRQGSIPALQPAEIIKESVQAEGATYRMEVAQTEGHPWTSKVTAFIEACGTNAIGTFTTGFATMMPPSDNAPFFDAECVEVRGAYDPNDKEGFPKGVCNRRFVFNDTDLEYKIRFQNTGTDTAFKVEIRDTLSELLDPTTLQMVNASHDYDWNITANGTLVFTFENIMLPDSNVNEAASHGFIQYKIKQQSDNLIDAEIENRAAIYFDFNAPIITNTVLHTVGDDFLTNQLGNLTIAGKITRPCGTPVDSVLVYLSDNCITYTNEQGDYIFENIEANQDYVVRAEKEDPVPKYLNVLDIIRLREMMFNIGSVATFYDLFASDVNRSNSTSTLDIVAINKVILGVTDEFPNGRDPWTFFNEAYSPTNPISDIDRFSLSNLIDDSLENNFIATKQGDLVSEKDFGSSTDTTLVKIGNNEISVCGDQVFVEIDIINVNQATAGQFSLKWDDTVLKFNENINLPFAVSSANGTANFMYFRQSHPDSIPQDIKLTVLFDVVGNVGDETIIEFEPDGIEPIFLDGNQNLTPFSFSSTTIKIAAENPLSLFLITIPPTTSNSNDGRIGVNRVVGGASSGVFQFNWSNGETSPLIDNLPPGEYMVTVTDASTGCMTDTTIVLSPITSTNGLFFNENLQIKIAPNPTFNGKQASVQIKSNYLQKGKIEITDALGRLIHSKQFKTRALEEIIQLESDWPPGIYLVSVFLDKEGMKTIKWVVD